MQPSAMPRWITSLSMLVVAGGLASSDAWAAAARCQLQSIELREPGGSSEWVAITTDRPANFTSFKLARPSRIVVDFPETTAVTRKAEGPTGGPVSNWSVEMLGSGEQIVARLTIELREDADYTLTNTSGTLALRFMPATARPLTALEHDPAPAPAAEPKVEPPHDDAAERAAAEKAAAQRAEVARAEKEKVDADRLAAQKAEQVRLAKEKAEQDRVAQEKAKAEKARVVAEAKERARLEAEAAKAQKIQAEKDRREKEAQARREARERAAAEKARRMAEAKARADQLKAEREAAKARAAAEREARRAEARAREETRRVAASARTAVLERVAFHRSANGAELTLKLSEPVVHATREEGGRLILDLEHTKITLPNNRRELDTRFFGTAVSRITPREDRSTGRVSIEMELGTPAPYEVKADGTTIAVLFQSLPATTGSAGFSAVR